MDCDMNDFLIHYYIMMCKHGVNHKLANLDSERENKELDTIKIECLRYLATYFF